MSAHDRHLAQFSTGNVHVVCGVCENEWEDTQVSEYGAVWLEAHEDCSECGATGDWLRITDSQYEPDWDSIREERDYERNEPWT